MANLTDVEYIEAVVGTDIARTLGLRSDVEKIYQFTAAELATLLRAVETRCH